MLNQFPMDQIVANTLKMLGLPNSGGSRGGARGACPVSHRWFTSSSLLAASVRRLKINLLNGFCLQLLVLCLQSRSSSPLREVPIQNFKVKKHIMVDVI